jgi:putative component of toxin-antitoxin plasmid stabilization module
VTIKRITARFYRTATGSQPVREWLLNELNKTDRGIVGLDIANVEFGWPLGMPVCRPIGGGIWEVRSTITAGKVEARIYFAVDQGEMILLNAHTGKGKQNLEIATAVKRWNDYRERLAAQRGKRTKENKRREK